VSRSLEEDFYKDVNLANDLNQDSNYNEFYDRNPRSFNNTEGRKYFRKARKVIKKVDFSRYVC
jgi:hypothetical protein